jgi:lipopolysaccharide/colanic/teichoic acid biosynthesis glycosyltransferase
MRVFIETCVAVVVLVLLIPVLSLIGLAIVLDSPGSPFYFAPRVGKGGKPFRMLKFRTMVTGAARIGPPITGRRDPRITRVGQFLRVTKLDELPQFVNVMLGDMSLVGPRPEAPDLVALYTPEQRAVLAVRPGITGASQLASREESDSIPENVKADEYYLRHIMQGKVQSDIDYIRRRSLRMDLQILAETAMYVLRNFGRRVATVFRY